MISYSKILKCTIIIFKKRLFSHGSHDPLMCCLHNILSTIRINLQADVFLKKMSPLAICVVCVFWLWSEADIPPFFCHNLHCLMRTKCTYFLWTRYLPSLLFSHFSFPLFGSPFAFFFSSDSTSTGKCQKISHSRHTQEPSVSSLPHS